MADNKEYTLWIDGRPVPVTEQVYKDYYKMKRREKYLEESDTGHGKVSYHALDTDEFGGEEILADSSRNVEDEAITNIMIEKMLNCLHFLTADEHFLVEELYYKCKSQRQLAKESGIPLMTICDRNKRMLEKLRKRITE